MVLQQDDQRISSHQPLPRIAQLTQHLSPSQPQAQAPTPTPPASASPSPPVKMSGKDPITCHVLDTTAGIPGRNIRVRLEGPLPPASSTFASTAPSSSASANAPTTGSSEAKIFESQTDDDGRIKLWLPFSSPTSSGEVPVYTLVDVLADVKGPSRWVLKFDTAGYFGEDKTFFPEATIVFRVEEGQGYHVPLLLSPFSYTTYRGS